MADVKKVDKTAESTGFANVGVGEAYPKTARPQAATLAEARAQRAAEDQAVKEAQDKVAAEVAERTVGEAKPTKRTEGEMAAGKKAVGK